MCALAVLEGGRQFVSGSSDKTLRFWSLESGQCLHQVELGSGVDCIAISPGGERLLMGCTDSRLRLFDTQSREVGEAIELPERLKFIRFLPDGRFAIVGYSSSDKIRGAQVVDVLGRSLLNQLPGCEIRTNDAAITPDGRYAITAEQDYSVRFYELDWDYEFPAQVPWHEDARPFVRAFLDARADKPRQADNFQPLMVDLQRRGFGWLHEEGIQAVVTQMQADRRKTVEMPVKEQISIPDTLMSSLSSEPDRILEGHQSDVCALAFTADGDRLVSGERDGILRMWDLRTGRCQQVLGQHPNWLTAIAVAGNGRRIISGSDEDDSFEIWPLGGMGFEDLPLPSREQVLTLRDWDPLTGECLLTFLPHRQTVSALALAGDQLIVAGYQTIELYDIMKGKKLRTYRGHKDFIEGLALLPGNRYFVSVCRDHSVRIWDLKSGRCRASHPNVVASPTAMVLAPDGRTVFLCDREQMGIIQLDLETGEEVRRLRGHERMVIALAIAPKQGILFSGGNDGTLRSWQLAAAGRSLHGCV